MSNFHFFIIEDLINSWYFGIERVNLVIEDKHKILHKFPYVPVESTFWFWSISWLLDYDYCIIDMQYFLSRLSHILFRCFTESSDEGISLSYHPQSVESELLEELRRNVTELRIQLERERQRCTFLEQSYTYSLMAAQVAQQPSVTSATSVTALPATSPTTAAQQAPADGTTEDNTSETLQHTAEPLHAAVSANHLPPSPPQSRHTSTDELVCTCKPIPITLNYAFWGTFTTK